MNSVLGYREQSFFKLYRSASIAFQNQIQDNYTNPIEYLFLLLAVSYLKH